MSRKKKLPPGYHVGRERKAYEQRYDRYSRPIPVAYSPPNMKEIEAARALKPGGVKQPTLIPDMEEKNGAVIINEHGERRRMTEEDYQRLTKFPKTRPLDPNDRDSVGEYLSKMIQPSPESKKDMGRLFRVPIEEMQSGDIIMTEYDRQKKNRIEDDEYRQKEMIRARQMMQGVDMARQGILPPMIGVMTGDVGLSGLSLALQIQQQENNVKRKYMVELPLGMTVERGHEIVEEIKKNIAERIERDGVVIVDKDVTVDIVPLGHDE